MQDWSTRTFSGATIVSLFYEATDSLTHNRIFYLKDIYRSAIMGQARKIVDKFQTEQLQKIESSIQDEEMPFEDHFFEDIISDFERDLKEELSCDEFKILPFSMGIRYVEDLRLNFQSSID